MASMYGTFPTALK